MEELDIEQATQDTMLKEKYYSKKIQILLINQMLKNTTMCIEIQSCQNGGRLFMRIDVISTLI